LILNEKKSFFDITTMSLSMLTFRSDTKFAHEGLLGRRKNRRGLRRSQVLPALPADVDNENGKKSRRKFRPVEPTSLDDVCRRLRYNEISSLKIGFQESNFLTSKRCGNQLDTALIFNTSLTSISIGWRHSSREALLLLIRAVTRHTRLRHIQLILDDWLPEHMLRHLLQRQSETIETIDIRALHVRRKSPLGRLCCEQREKPLAATSWHRSCGPCDHCVVSRVLVQLHTYLPRLQTLYLQDCGLQDSHAVMLADYLHIRGGVQELSLRNNRQLGPHGVAVLCQAPVLSLDLSLCDMSTATAAALAPAIASRQWPLQQLTLCGNYQMGRAALLSLLEQETCNKLVALDVSYCEITGNRAVAMFQAMTKLNPSTRLQKIIMQGAHVANNNATEALCQLLNCNVPIRVLRLDHRDKPFGFSALQLRKIAKAICDNYEVEELVVDSWCTQAERGYIWKDVDFFLRLNRCGRRILLCRDRAAIKNVLPSLTRESDLEWMEVLGRASDDFNLLYWMVRHSAERFG
jgi:hypothetical protein